VGQGLLAVKIDAMTYTGWTTPPTSADFTDIAEEALAEIPAFLRRHVTDVAIFIEDIVDTETERDMGLDSPYELLGLYRGVALPQKSIADIPSEPDQIFLYRLPILATWCESGEPLADIIRHVLIHEIGHHFGFSDADLERIEADR
jgi:predicted Zn-dependent protease with MMP-like domain